MRESLYPSSIRSSAFQSRALSLLKIDFPLSKNPPDKLLDANCFQIVFGFLLKCISNGEHLILDWKEDRRFQMIFEMAVCNVGFC